MKEKKKQNRKEEKDKKMNKTIRFNV